MQISIHRKWKTLIAASALVVGLSSLQALGQSEADASAAVTDLGFSYASGKSKLEIAFDKDVIVEKSVSEADKQVILDIKNAKIGSKWARRIDTSQHKSNISLVSPYQSGDVVRIVLQLKDIGDVDISQDGTKIVALIDNKQSADDSVVTAEAEAAASAAATATDDVPSEMAAAPSTSASVAETTSTETSAEGEASLDGFFEAQRVKSYSGRKINIQLRDAPLKDAFRLIGQTSAFNIVMTEAVTGNITIELIDVPWDQALDLLLHNNKLAAERHGNVLRVTSLEALTKEKELQLAASKASEASEALVVKVFPISYADPGKLATIVDDFLSYELPSANEQAQQGITGSGTTATTKVRRGTVKPEDRTNSLIVRDTAVNIEKIKRVIKELDTQTPQILVEAKFVEVSENKTNIIAGRIFATSREFTGGSFGFNNTKNNFGALFGGGGFDTIGNGFAISPVAGGASLGFMPKAALLPGIGEIGALLQILETESAAKIIASPRIVTQNKQAASISQGQAIQLATAPGPQSSGGFTTISATLTLNVTPQVTNDGGIIMNVDFSQSTPAASSIQGSALTTNTKTVKTNVLIDSGGTLVIGGVYTSTENESAEGIPILRELPIIGPLFGSKGKLTSKGELFIFLTPRILNDKESGLRG